MSDKGRLQLEPRLSAKAGEGGNQEMKPSPEFISVGSAAHLHSPRELSGPTKASRALSQVQTSDTRQGCLHPRA